MLLTILPCIFFYTTLIAQSTGKGDGPFRNSTLQSSCTNTTDCIGNQVCQDGFCHCAPDYRNRNNTGQCQAFMCQTSGDCHASDLYRVCQNGKCVCDGKVYFPDHGNGGKCTLTKCHDQQDCSHNHTVCQTGKCRCAENYWYNTTLGDCSRFYCQITLDCSYEGAVCANGTCVCGPMYKPDKYEGGLCTMASKTYGKACDEHVKCDWKEREVCVDRECQCESDYRNNSGHCEPFTCQQPVDCQSYDEHRICASGKCVCDHNSVQNETNGNKCGLKSATYGHHCSADSDCSEPNQRCVGHQCICDVDYQFVTGIELCEPISCANTTADVCFASLDEQRVCDNTTGHCLCKQGYHEEVNNGRKCRKDKKKPDYTLVIILVPSVFGVVVVCSFIWIVISKWRKGNTPTNRTATFGLNRMTKGN